MSTTLTFCCLLFFFFFLILIYFLLRCVWFRALLGAGGRRAKTVGELCAALERAYCGSLSVELAHLDADEREWLAAALEAAPHSSVGGSGEERRRFGQLLLQSQAFDQFVHRKLRMVKRYGLEGAEALLVATDSLFGACVRANIDDVVIGMPHRGRNNLLALLLRYPVEPPP